MSEMEVAVVHTESDEIVRVQRVEFVDFLVVDERAELGVVG